MYELIRVGNRTCYIDSPSKIGIYQHAGAEVCLIDSGNDGGAAKKVLRHLEAEGWALSAIFNTHSHADHVGGNALLHQIDDELAHHFIAVRAGGDADAADRFAVRGVSAAFDAPSLFDGQGDAGDRRQCLEQNDPLLFGRKALQRGCGMNRQPPVISYLIQRGDGRIRRCTRYRRHRPFLRYDANTNTVFLQVNEAKFHLLRG